MARPRSPSRKLITKGQSMWLSRFMGQKEGLKKRTQTVILHPLANPCIFGFAMVF